MFKDVHLRKSELLKNFGFLFFRTNDTKDKGIS